MRIDLNDIRTIHSVLIEDAIVGANSDFASSDLDTTDFRKTR
jgi:hypothetical protein